MLGITRGVRKIPPACSLGSWAMGPRLPHDPGPGTVPDRATLGTCHSPPWGTQGIEGVSRAQGDPSPDPCQGLWGHCCPPSAPGVPWLQPDLHITGREKTA